MTGGALHHAAIAEQRWMLATLATGAIKASDLGGSLGAHLEFNFQGREVLGLLIDAAKPVEEFAEVHRGPVIKLVPMLKGDFKESLAQPLMEIAFEWGSHVFYVF